MQLDIFEHSRDVMLRNDVLQALDRLDATRARACWETLALAYPCDDALPALFSLIEATAAHGRHAKPPIVLVDHAALAQAQLALTQELAPAVQSLMDTPRARVWLLSFWRSLIERSAHLPYLAEAPSQHVAPMLLHIHDWQGAQEAVARIESWRRIPTPLAWMTQARLNQLGLQASWPLVAELAWLAPQRLNALMQTASDPILKGLAMQFDAEFDARAQETGSPTEPDADLAWFPAWVLTARPQLAPHLALAQAGNHSAPEQAMRLLVNLLGLERQGRLHDIVSHRKRLRDLHPGLYANYIKTR